jgi:hypothetical protein
LRQMIAFCGLNCYESGAFLATKENDDRKRATVAQEWSGLFKVEIKPEDINCDGCLFDGECLFNYCKVCEIRKYGKRKGLKNCGYCGEYRCYKLEFLYLGMHRIQKTAWIKSILPLNSASYPSVAKVITALLIYSLKRI